MQITEHVIISAILWFPVWVFTGNYVLATAFFLAGWMIDADHYLYFVLKTRTFYIDSAYDYFAHGCVEDSRLLFHSIETLSVLWLFGFVTQNACLVAVASAFTLHVVSDAISDRIRYKKFRRMSLL